MIVFGLAIIIYAIAMTNLMPVNAQSITLSPETLTVAGTRDTLVSNMGITRRGNEQKVKREILIEAGHPLQNLQPITLDLFSNDGLVIFPAEQIEVKLEPISSINDNLIKAKIYLNLAKALNSGEFAGKLLLRYDKGQVYLPMKVQIKDDWFLPLLVLLIGVVLGSSLSWYRSQGRPRDEILVRASHLRHQIESEPHLERCKPFERYIKRKLHSSNYSLQAENWESAKEAIADAQKAWQHWLAYESDWLEQAEYYEKLKDSRTKLSISGSSSYLIQVERRMEKSFEEAPTKTLENLSENLRLCGEALRYYAEIKMQFDLIRGQLSDLEDRDPESFRRWNSQRKELLEDFNNLKPFTEKGEEITPDDSRILDRVRQLTQEISKDASSRSAPLQTSVDVPIAPVFRSIEEDFLASKGRHSNRQQIEKALAWLRLKFLFPYAASVTMIVFLASYGFQEFYIINPTFGSRPVADYFGLLAWGFGAEASRESVSKVLGNLTRASKKSSPGEEG